MFTKNSGHLTDAYAGPTVAIAGGSGDLGCRIVKALVGAGAVVRSLVRPDVRPAERSRLEALGAQIVAADPLDIEAMRTACLGTVCVVSALNGLGDVMLTRQTVLLDAAVSAGVSRFISSDFAADFTKTRPGENRNFDFRREFRARADASPMAVTSILNGAFMDMLGHEMPLLQPSIRRVLYWHNADQPLDFTTKDNVAAYTARVALDAHAPRLLRIAGDVVSVRGLTQAMTESTGKAWHPLWVGSLGMLRAIIAVAKRISPAPDVVFPPWQGMQYMRDQFSGLAKLEPLDNDRYSDIVWTSFRGLLAQRREAASKS